jgi:hypothetical protein
MQKLSPSTNRPALASAAAAFVGALIAWGADALAGRVPDTVVTSGTVLLLLIAGAAIGGATQYVGRKAPWAFDTHVSAVAYALSLDPAQHQAELEAALRHLGVDSIEDAERIIGART